MQSNPTEKQQSPFNRKAWIKNEMVKHLLTHWDYISKIDALRELGNYFPSATIRDRVDAWEVAYEDYQ